MYIPPVHCNCARNFKTNMAAGSDYCSDNFDVLWGINELEEDENQVEDDDISELPSIG